ncbi:MAG: hypothetical protein AB1371_08585 [Pseudomonadota bacterium]
MKKLAIAAAAAAALTAGVANAYTTGTFSNGFVVPNVYHNGSGDTTAVGVINGRSSSVAVHWVFYDQDSVHKRDGCFVMTANDFEPFVWAAPKSGSNTLDVSGLAGTRGYLVFAVGTDSAGARDDAALKTTCDNYENIYLPSTTSASNASAQVLAGAAFHVKTATSDVAYVPVIDGPLASTLTPAVSFSSSTNDPVTSVAGAADASDTHFLRFFTAGGAKTDIVIWNSAAYNAGQGASAQFSKVAFPYDTNQGSYGSITLPLTKKELNIFDAGTVVGTTPNDGFIRWTPMASATTPGVFTYSVINAPAFGALQSIVNPYLSN